jgi:uncharacterized membrane protein
VNERLALWLRATVYALRGGFLIRPFLIALVFGAAGALLSFGEERAPGLAAWIPEAMFPARADPQVAQTILTVIAESIMTVVSIVFAILLMTLTLASTQFSPRILVSFVRDKATQWTLGIFLGTFSYCMAALPATRSLPRAYVPVLTVMAAMALALVCVGWLIFFINHISRSISVNHIVDRIAGEAEMVIDDLMPHTRGLYEGAERPPPTREGRERVVPSPRSGYLRFVDVGFLVDRAKTFGVQIHLERRVGQFVPAGVALMRVVDAGRVTPEREATLLSAIDIGPTRTMQQDIEFGIIQLVDIALRAISPAVNDPTTAINCIDQLARVMIVFAGRAPPPAHMHAPPHVLRLAMPWIDYEGLLDTAFEQIRHYARTDIAVSLRLLRAFDDMLAAGTSWTGQRSLLERARRVVAGCERDLPGEDMSSLRRRLAGLEERARGLGFSTRDAAG